MRTVFFIVPERKQMIRHMILTVVCAAVAALSASCGYFQAMHQRGKLADIRVGMTKDQVVEIAGEPLSKELYSTDNYWFYYTSPKWYDGLVTQDECTPFLFDDDGILQGWGNRYFRKHGIMSVWTQEAINSSIWFF